MKRLFLIIIFFVLMGCSQEFKNLDAYRDIKVIFSIEEPEPEKTTETKELDEMYKAFEIS